MDWGRAKTILILSFLFLNMILGYQLWTSKSKQTELAADTTGIVEELNRVLSSKNIRLSEELPKDVPKLTEITVKFDENMKPDEKIPLKTPTTMNSILGKGTSKDVPARSEIPHLDLYQFDAIASKDGVYVFNQMYGGLPMFEVRVELFEDQGQVTKYRQTYVVVEASGEQKEQKLIPAQLAVRSLVENYLSEGSIITDVRLGYHGQIYNSQTQYMIPYWRVAIGNGDIYYVQAFNGAVEAPQNGFDNGPVADVLPKKKDADN
ncbi:two-component system regulatory protein YycI [Paenibacillus athensensis]|uniref:Regulatory protein YycH-like domain-containing protein n=1 Tax=Paenibacillus athensensis TaxID=1967502 RepID=A0A4Y8PV43_9BACL|nr:two-component system regulatory protein YycI [Paenibacillus athensensis]MCD1261833.1 two-component system regulatory protein YycI [Paenibacillus athensensis]